MAVAGRCAAGLKLPVCSPLRSGSTVGVNSASECGRCFASSKSKLLTLVEARHSSERRAFPVAPSSSSTSVPRRMSASAVPPSKEVSAPTSEKIKPSGSSPFTLTYLEGNTWLWEIVGLRFLVDPVMVGNLDFGIPLLYDAKKKVTQNLKLEDLPELDYLLICQGYDDHCHEKTLAPLSQMRPNLPVIASPNAEKILGKYFKNVTYLEPRNGESTTLKAKNGSNITIRASPGPTLGPPWQRPENGYFVEVEDPKFTIYYEPHCIFENVYLRDKRADVVLTPVIQQVLPGYVLVSGQEDAVKVAEWLKPKFIVTMRNGDLEAKGLLSKIVSQKGTTERFEEMLSQKLPDTKVLNPLPGIPLDIPIGC
ncbi:hypothetical protein R1sor_005487 [Riccia sorocarpa]|uniref:Metallo-beta-lactamase domain-containing protein n=1 Tax=Riccia sorocarpa TaxID=122646 RepID=A0ABD3HM02_9MARC